MNNVYIFRPFYAVNAIRIEADDESAWVLDKIALVDGEQDTMQLSGPEVPVWHMRIGSLGSGLYRVEADGQETVETGSPLYIALVRIKEKSEMSPDFFGLHAAAVEYKGRVHVFMAPTGQGKTSLTAFLCAHGARLYGDDLTLIHRNSLTVYPSQKSVMLREPSLALLKEYGIDLRSSALPVQDGEYDRYRMDRLVRAEEIRGIDAIYQIRVAEEHRMVPVEDERERMQAMMLNAMRHERFTMAYLGFMQALSRIPMYELQYRDFNWVLEQL